jgi:hypothetical protein
MLSHGFETGHISVKTNSFKITARTGRGKRGTKEMWQYHAGSGTPLSSSTQGRFFMPPYFAIDKCL